MITDMQPTGFDDRVATLATSDDHGASAELRAVGQKLTDYGGLPLMRRVAWNAFGSIDAANHIRFGQALNEAWRGVGGWPGRGTYSASPAATTG